MDALTLSRRAETREVIFGGTPAAWNETGEEEYLRLQVVSAAEGTEPEGYTLLATRGQCCSTTLSCRAGSPTQLMTQVEEGFSCWDNCCPSPAPGNRQSASRSPIGPKF